MRRVWPDMPLFSKLSSEEASIEMLLLLYNCDLVVTLSTNIEITISREP